MTKSQHYILLLVVIISPFISNSQTSPQTLRTLDSLYESTHRLSYNYDYAGAIAESDGLIKLSIDQKNDHYTSLGYSRLGAIYLSMKDSINCFDFYNRSLEFAKKAKNDTVIADVYNDIGNAIMVLDGNVIEAQTNFKKSLSFNNRDGKPKLGIIINNINLAWTHLNLKELNQALPYLNYSRNAIENDTTLHPLYSIGLDVLRGRYHLYRNTDLNRAIDILKSAAERASSGNFLEEAYEAQKYLSIAYEKNGDLTEAIASIKKENEFRIEHEKLIRKQQLAETSTKHKLQQFQQEAELAKKEQIISDTLVSKSKEVSIFFIVISIILLLGLLSVFLLYRSRRKLINRLREQNIELTEAKENAERLSKLKTQFFSTVSHELRTPLYGVIGLSSILLDDVELKSHKDDLKSLKFSADYLLALINDVLTLNKADAQGMKLEKTPFSLKKLVESIVNSFSFSLQQNNNKINVVIDEAIPRRLLGDSIKLSQILMNLVGNAVKFNENGTIEIIIKLVERTRDGVYRTQFFIKDNGIGIPKEKQASIFEEFSQVENNNYNYQGTGLGLPIVKKLLDVFGSEIALQSDVGRGAIFSFIIPLEENTSTVDTEAEELLATSKQTPSFENVHILIVDDNKINQKVTQKILQSRSFKTSLADDGQEAVTLAQKQDFGLILMDIHMPVMGGVEATKVIRSFDDKTPIIALTAVEIEEARKAILDAGMNDIILKPYDVAQFLTVILRNLTVAFNRNQ
ncbi:histidine kinase [Patiriisocius marinus]|uniref:histidine kinase n=1 Tax=Patiriisocius marinus TaxID=1397112 RepID=A0A5J4IYF7_9FLAO|nr:response regulator [Patiriisocius marinus]GER58688.1 histidine kinase [Patiriisocius marinus]